jgi:hypothetical protein
MLSISFSDFLERLQKVKNTKITLSYDGTVNFSPLFFDDGIDFNLYHHGTFFLGERDCEWYSVRFPSELIKEVHSCCDDSIFCLKFTDNSKLIIESEVEELC